MAVQLLVAGRVAGLLGNTNHVQVTLSISRYANATSSSRSRALAVLVLLLSLIRIQLVVERCPCSANKLLINIYNRPSSSSSPVVLLLIFHFLLFTGNGFSFMFIPVYLISAPFLFCAVSSLLPPLSCIFFFLL